MKRFALIVMFYLLTSVALSADEFADTKALAEQGHADAQFNLGISYKNGDGVPQNYGEAYVWWSLAATSGHADGKRNRDSIAKELSPEALNSAQKHAAKLFEEIQQRKAVK